MSDFYDADCAEGEPRGRKPTDGPQEVVSSAHPDCPGGAVPRQRTRLGRGGTMRCPVAWTWLHGRTEGQGPRGAAQGCVAGERRSHPIGSGSAAGSRFAALMRLGHAVKSRLVTRGLPASSRGKYWSPKRIPAGQK